MKKEAEDFTRPSVQVRVPDVTLRIEDLAYLRSVSQPNGLRCSPTRATLDRLRFLDLIARANVPPSKERLDAAKKESGDLRKKLVAAVNQDDWVQVNNLSYKLRDMSRGLESREDDVLTEKGKQLLRQGNVEVKVRKVGCAKEK